MTMPKSSNVSLVGSAAFTALIRASIAYSYALGAQMMVPCEPPRYRWHLGCILLKMPAISLLTGPRTTWALLPIDMGRRGATR